MPIDGNSYYDRYMLCVVQRSLLGVCLLNHAFVVAGTVAAEPDHERHQTAHQEAPARPRLHRAVAEQHPAAATQPEAVLGGQSLPAGKHGHTERTVT